MLLMMLTTAGFVTLPKCFLVGNSGNISSGSGVSPTAAMLKNNNNKNNVNFKVVSIIIMIDSM